MFDKDYVLAELRNGRDFNDIMDEMSDILNEAAKIFEDEKTEERARQNERLEMADDIINAVYDYMIDYYGTSIKNIDKINKMFKDVTAEALIEAFDQLWNLSDSINEFADALADFEKMFKSKEKKKSIDPKGEIKVEVNLSDLVDDLLKILN